MNDNNKNEYTEKRLPGQETRELTLNREVIGRRETF